MIQVFVEPEQISGDNVYIDGEDAHHLLHVLRTAIGEPLEVSSGQGLVFHAVVERLGSTWLQARLTGHRASRHDPQLEIVLYQGVAKGQRMDYAVQKAVELGVSRIVPFVSRYTVVQLGPEKRTRRRERWQRIAREAARQTLRDCIPVVDEALAFPRLREQIEQERQQNHLSLLASEHEEQEKLTAAADCPERVSVIIGPEGGFTPDEVEQMAAAGAQPISLGPRILRSETAAVVALTLVGYCWGDLR